MEIKMIEHQDWLAGRRGGRVARSSFLCLIQDIPANDRIVFNFAGVEMISSSFADEFFAKLVEHFGIKQFKALTTFTNVTPMIATVVKSAISRRNQLDQLIS